MAEAAQSVAMRGGYVIRCNVCFKQKLAFIKHAKKKDEKHPDQSSLWDSWIQLGEDFYEAIVAAPVPVDIRALKALKRSPLALDLYAWATYTAYRTHKSGQARALSWELLHEQLGGEYTNPKEFARKARLALRKVQTVYPALGLEFVKGGVKILPCNPAITMKLKR
jgi:hypothetical protein